MKNSGKIFSGLRGLKPPYCLSKIFARVFSYAQSGIANLCMEHNQGKKEEKKTHNFRAHAPKRHAPHARWRRSYSRIIQKVDVFFTLTMTHLLCYSRRTYSLPNTQLNSVFSTSIPIIGDLLHALPEFQLMRLSATQRA